MFTGNYKKLIYVLILIIPFFVFFQGFNWIRNFSSGIIGLTSAPFKLITAPLFELKKIVYYHWTFNEYRRLKKETDELRSRLIAQQELVEENARLSQLLEIKRRLVFSSTAASVIGRNPSYWNSSMIINKGSRDGIKPGMAVVNALGVVGKIAEVTDGASKVVLLTDPAFSVAALVDRSRETALVSGSLTGVCRMRYINLGADIEVGDKIITSALSNAFPEGLMVGEVTSVIAGGEGRPSEYFVKPAVSLSQLEEVLVIIR